jgi:hypothetical protein
MAKYTPPEQPKILQLIDVVFIVGAIFVSLMLPLWLGWVSTGKTLTAIANPTWELLKQTPAQAEQWQKLGKDVAAAHDIIQNRYDYTLDPLQLIIMIVVLVGYFVFLFKASDKEYRDVIDEKFGKK